jgi:hypothetical protein
MRYRAIATPATSVSAIVAVVFGRIIVEVVEERSVRSTRSVYDAVRVERSLAWMLPSPLTAVSMTEPTPVRLSKNRSFRVRSCRLTISVSPVKSLRSVTWTVSARKGSRFWSESSTCTKTRSRPMR